MGKNTTLDDYIGEELVSEEENDVKKLATHNLLYKIGIQLTLNRNLPAPRTKVDLI